MNRKYQIELEQETDGRWIAEIETLSGEWFTVIPANKLF
jgi:hypothetical protein